MTGPRKFKVVWYYFDPNNETTTASARVDTLEEALALVPLGPVGWQRYRITQGKRFIERGDQFGPRAARIHNENCSKM
jgi:hypothetical protein